LGIREPKTMLQQTKGKATVDFSIGETRVQHQVYKLVIKGEFGERSFNTLCDRISSLKELSAKKKVFFLIDFSRMTPMELKKIKHYPRPSVNDITNIIFIIYDFDETSKLLFRILFPRVLVSNIYYEKNESSAVLRANRMLSKEQLDSMPVGVSAITGIQRTKVKVRDKSFDWVHDKQWRYSDVHGSYLYEIELIDYNIFVAKPSGYIKYDNSLSANVLFDKVVYQTLGHEKKYYRIQDYSQVSSTSLSARRDFMAYIIDHIERINLIVFFGLNTYMKAIVKFGILFHPQFSKVRVVDTLEDALTTVLVDKYGKDIFDAPEKRPTLSTTEQEELVALRKEVKELKARQNVDLDTLFQRVSNIAWEVENNEMAEYNEEDTVFADVYGALNLLRRDLQDRNREWDELSQQWQQQIKSDMLEIKRLRKDIHHMHLLKDEFIQQVNHELRTPLQSLTIGMDLLRQEKLEQERNRYFDIVYAAGKALTKKVRQIKDISDLNLRKQELTSSLFNINSVLQDQIEMRFPIAVSKKIEIVYEKDAAVPQYLMGDLSKIIRVIDHFLDNAITYTNQGKIVVRTKLIEDMETQIRLRVEVEDTGIGINKNTQEHLFEDVNISGSLSGAYASNVGFGLFVCKQLTELMAGDIGFQSEVNKGSCFYIILTLNKGVFLKEMNLINKGAKKLLKIEKIAGKVVLVANSDDQNILAGQAFFEKLGVNIIFAHNDQHILNLYQTKDFDILILDVTNFSTDSLSAVAKIRENEALANQERHIPIIGITANPNESLHEDSLQAGVDRLLVKPFSLASLNKVLRELL